jgi:hypothetical protein
MWPTCAPTAYEVISDCLKFEKQWPTHYKCLTTGWTTGVRFPAGERIFPLSSVSIPALGPTQPPVQWVPGVLSPGVKARPGRDADHSPPSSAEVENE